jgi:hypothetical protein
VVPVTATKEDPDSGVNPKENIPAKDTIRQKVKPKEPVPGKVPVSPNSKSKQPVQHKDTLKSKTNPGANASVAMAGTPKKKSAEKPPAKDTVKSKLKAPVQAVKKDSTTRKAIAAAGTPKPEKSAGKPVPGSPVKTKEVKSPPPTPSGDVVFRVQIATSAKELSVHSKKFEGLQNIWKYQHQGVFKYTTGKESTPEALSGVLGEAKKLGFTDAFIVAFHGEERITVAEGRKLISEGVK